MTCYMTGKLEWEIKNIINLYDLNKIIKNLNTILWEKEIENPEEERSLLVPIVRPQNAVSENKAQEMKDMRRQGAKP